MDAVLNNAEHIGPTWTGNGANHHLIVPPGWSDGASGAKKVVLARNTHLADAIQRWAFSSMRGSPGAKAYYHSLRDRNIGHQAALRQLGNRWVGILHGCLKSNELYDENTAWAPPETGCPPLPSPAATGTTAQVSHPHSINKRLTGNHSSDCAR